MPNKFSKNELGQLVVQPDPIFPDPVILDRKKAEQDLAEAIHELNKSQENSSLTLSKIDDIQSSAQENVAQKQLFVDKCNELGIV